MRSFAVASLAVLFLLLCAGCVSVPEVSFDPEDDFGRYQTWDWLPSAAQTFDTPANIDGLNRKLTRLVARELRRQGLERVQGGADLRIGAVLNVRRENATVLETGAIRQLLSHNASTSYHIQSTVSRTETREHFRLVVIAADARSGQIVWRGSLEDWSRDDFSAHMGRTVENLLARFPASGASRKSPGRDPGTEGPTKFAVPPPRLAPDEPPADPDRVALRPPAEDTEHSPAGF